MSVGDNDRSEWTAGTGSPYREKPELVPEDIV